MACIDIKNYWFTSCLLLIAIFWDEKLFKTFGHIFGQLKCLLYYTVDVKDFTPGWSTPAASADYSLAMTRPDMQDTGTLVWERICSNNPILLFPFHWHHLNPLSPFNSKKTVNKKTLLRKLLLKERLLSRRLDIWRRLNTTLTLNLNRLTLKNQLSSKSLNKPNGRSGQLFGEQIQCLGSNLNKAFINSQVFSLWCL